MEMKYIEPLLDLANEMSPYLLLGFFFAGLLHVFVPKGVYSKYLSRSDFRAVLYTALFGVPLPLCSCGVIPMAMSLRKEGASKGAVASFLIATPQTGVDSILATYSVLGLPFAVIRPVAALATALAGGMAVNKASKGEAVKEAGVCGNSVGEKGRSARGKLAEAFRYGFVGMPQDVGKWLVLGLLVAGLITVAVPDAFFSRFAGAPLLNMLIVLVFSMPMYLCSTGSIPIAAALMMKGLPPGAAFVLLMAGPATSFASMLLINKVLGNKAMWIYLLSIAAGAVGFGLLIDLALPGEWFANVKEMAHGCHGGGTPLWKWVSSGVFAILLINAFLQKHIHKHKDKMAESAENKTVYCVGGMSCNHCKASIEEAIKGIEGCLSAQADVAAGTVAVGGEVPEADIKRAVEGLGFEYKGPAREA